MKDLMRFVQRVAEDRPILISGDFNAEPTEPVYSTVINYAPLNLSSAYADLLASISNNGVERKECKNGDETNGENIQNGENNQNGDQNRAEYLIGNEPPYTTWKIREDGEVCHTIDYVFYSRDKLKVMNRLEIMTFCHSTLQTVWHFFLIHMFRINFRSTIVCDSRKEVTLAKIEHQVITTHPITSRCCAISRSLAATTRTMTTTI